MDPCWDIFGASSSDDEDEPAAAGLFSRVDTLLPQGFRQQHMLTHPTGAPAEPELPEPEPELPDGTGEPLTALAAVEAAGACWLAEQLAGCAGASLSRVVALLLWRF